MRAWLRLHTIPWLIALVFASGALQGEDLPRKQAGDSAEETLLFDQFGEFRPDVDLEAGVLADPPPLDVEKERAAYQRAQAKELRWQKLGKSGVLAQVEVERATLQAARARARYEQARVAQQQAALAKLRDLSRGLPSDNIAAAESALQTAQTIAGEAAASLQRTELLLAEANVERQRRLLKLGAGSRHLLERAEAALTQLRTAAP